MTLKIFSTVTVMLCGFLIGLEGKNRLNRRLHSLEMFRSLFHEMKMMIAHSGLALDDIAYELADRHENNPFLQLLIQTLYQTSLHSGWKQCIEAQYRMLCLNAEDKKCLIDCAARLGQSNVEGELHTLSLIDDQLSSMVEEARQKAGSDGKIVTIVGSSCGIILALLLI